MFVFQKNDSKYQAWARSLAPLGINTTAVDGSPLKATAVLLRLLVSGERIQGYVFRYLNDYSSMSKTLLRLMTEVLVIFIVRLARGEVFWIAHNVDRESLSHHPRITRIRRRLLMRAARTVFVTDPLLLRHAQERMHGVRSWSWMCFGQPDFLPMNSETEKVKSAAATLRARLEHGYPGRRVLVGLCVSSASSKCTHFLTVTRFVEASTTTAVVAGVVVVGAVGSILDKRYEQALHRLREHAQVELIDGSIAVREQFLAGDFDFFYRAIDDLSVSFSVYVAASIYKPLITECGTFLAQMVKHYELGAVVDSCGDDKPIDLLGKLEGWDPMSATRFLAGRNWVVAATQFARAISSSR